MVSGVLKTKSRQGQGVCVCCMHAHVCMGVLCKCMHMCTFGGKYSFRLGGCVGPVFLL